MYVDVDFHDDIMTWEISPDYIPFGGGGSIPGVTEYVG